MKNQNSLETTKLWSECCRPSIAKKLMYTWRVKLKWSNIAAAQEVTESYRKWNCSRLHHM